MHYCGGGCRAAGSVSARFQTLLVYARKRDCLIAYYEGMLERYAALPRTYRALLRLSEGARSLNSPAMNGGFWEHLAASMAMRVLLGRSGSPERCFCKMLIPSSR